MAHPRVSGPPVNNNRSEENEWNHEQKAHKIIAVSILSQKRRPSPNHANCDKEVAAYHNQSER